MRQLGGKARIGVTAVFFSLSAALIAGSIVETALANPTAPTVTAGGATVSGLGTNAVTIHQATPKAIINWQQFNIAPNEVTRFIQPSGSAIALNRIFDANPSQIFGSLQANGSVILLNPNGIMFGPNAQVNVNGLIASALNLTDSNFLSGKYVFQGQSTNSWVRNAGTINGGAGGVYLLAPNVENSGVITSPEGSIALAAGTSAYLSNRADGRGLLVEVTAPAGEALNLNSLVADGGYVSMAGQVVNQRGLVQANTVREHNGRIELVASQQLNLAPGSRTVAKGADQGVSNGGTILALADKTTGQVTFARDAVIDTSGGRQGGNGGTVDVSGSQVALNGKFIGQAAPGYRGSRVLIDPTDVNVDSDYLNGFAGSGVSQVTIQADRDINVTGAFDPSQISANGGNITFTAGHDLLFQGAALRQGQGQGNAWNYLGTAGNDIVLSSSSIWTARGGTIELTATRDLRLVHGGSQDLSSLWTRDGGNITLKAGRDLSIPLVFDPATSRYMGVRIDGQGDVALSAGRDLLGGEIGVTQYGPGFVLSNGTATVTAGGQVGAPDSYANLTVAKAQVAINAGGDIYLSQVQDKGVSEGRRRTVTADPTNRVDLTSTNGSIHLKPDSSGTTDQGLGGIYPATFTASALGGSIFLESNLRFWPSITGSLVFSARDNIQGVSPTTLVPDPNFRPPNCNGNPCTEKQLVQRGFTQEEAGAILTPPFVPVRGNPTSVDLLTSDPALLFGSQVDLNLAARLSTPAQNVAVHQPAPISFTTTTGNIQTLNLNLYSGPFQKKVTISSGQDLKEFTATISVPESVDASVSAARNIDMTVIGAGGASSGIHFVGKGNGHVTAGGTLDLANSTGITHQTSLLLDFDQKNQPGSLDLAVGQDVQMTQSKIFTYNGANISIHGLSGPNSPIGGSVNVGTNAGSGEQDRGIVTVNGGGIDIRATGDVNVNQSRIATLGGGNINVTTINGDINAGSGGRNEVTTFIVSTKVVDPNTGQPVLDANGDPVLVKRQFQVPGSGIFTFYPPATKDNPAGDPFPLVFPTFDTPQITALKNEIIKQSNLGRDTTVLQHQVADLVAARQPSFTAEFEHFIAPLHLGDITLKAGRDIVVPPAGIRGRRITLEAGRNLNLQGGQIEGLTSFTAGGSVVGSLSSFNGAASGSSAAGSVSTAGGSSGGTVAPLAGATGGVAAPVSATASTASTASGTTTTLSDSAGSAVSSQSKAVANAVAPKSAQGVVDESRKKTFRVKQGVTIQVDVKAANP
jgi:filamentous hemagglutinin family protein